MSNYFFRVIRGSSEKGTSWAIVHDKVGTDSLHVINIDGITGEVTREVDISKPIEDDEIDDE